MPNTSQTDFLDFDWSFGVSVVHDKNTVAELFIC